MAFKGDTKALILATLQAGPLHGYEVVRRIRETGGAGKLSEGQIYPYMHELEAEGMVTAAWQTDTGAAPRRVYQLTESGRTELARHKETWAKFVNGVGCLLATGLAKEPGNG